MRFGRPNSLAAFLLAGVTLGAQPVPGGASPRALRLNADLLLRADDVSDLADRSDIRRGRLWLRPGFEVAPAGWLRFGGRGSFAIATDRNKDNILRFDNFHSNDVALDRLYVAVEKSGVEVQAGKFAMPFEVSEMIWDRDIQPSGLYAGYRRSWLALRAGVFHRSHIHHDRSTIAGGQLALRHRLSLDWEAEADAGLLVFNALDQFQPGMERQNRVRFEEGRLRYQSAFQLAHWRYRLSYRGVRRWPLVAESSYVHNFGAAEEQRAVEVKAQAGSVEKRGDWQFSYSFQKVGREAVVGAFSSDDWWFHSDHHGSRFTGAYSFLPHAFIRFAAVFQSKTGAGPLVKRFQIDLGVEL